MKTSWNNYICHQNSYIRNPVPCIRSYLKIETPGKSVFVSGVSEHSGFKIIFRPMIITFKLIVFSSPSPPKYYHTSVSFKVTVLCCYQNPHKERTETNSPLGLHINIYVLSRNILNATPLSLI